MIAGFQSNSKVSNDISLKHRGIQINGKIYLYDNNKYAE